MGTTQAQLEKHWIRIEEINVWPSVLEQNGKCSFIIWATICGASTCGFKSCSHNAICEWAYASDEKEPHSSIN